MNPYMEFAEVYPRIKKVFGVDANPSGIEFTEEIPDIAAIVYDSRGNCNIVLKPSRYEKDKDSLRWALSEKTAHFFHYKTNFQLFKEGIEISDREDKRENPRRLEISNLVELIGRLGGFYGGGTIPPDHNQTRQAWVSIMRECGEDLSPEIFREIFGAKMKDEKYANRVSLVSSRVWGTYLGDYIVANSGLSHLPDYELIRSLARAQTFHEVAQHVEDKLPKSKAAAEAGEIADRFFPFILSE